LRISNKNFGRRKKRWTNCKLTQVTINWKKNKEIGKNPKDTPVEQPKNQASSEPLADVGPSSPKSPSLPLSQSENLISGNDEENEPSEEDDDIEPL
jgi:hypothetical protein